MQRHVLSECQVFVTTAGNVTSKILGPAFGSKSNGIFIFVDEAAFLTEPQVVAVISQLSNRDKVKCLVLIGDHEQLAPFVQRDTFNEFAKQLERPLFCRLATTGSPVNFLAVQHRMHDCTCEH